MIAKTETIEQAGFCLAGISVRTTNQNGQSQKDIGGLWQQFMAHGLLQKISSRVSDDIYCVYTDYETDYTGFYIALIGCKIDALSHIPGGFTGMNIPGGKFRVYSLSGKFPENVHEAWQEIWADDADRAYTADYDLYGANAKSFEETEVKIYLAVK